MKRLRKETTTPVLEDAVVVGKPNDKRIVNAIIYEPGAGKPWVEQVEIKENNNFKLNDRDGTYYVSRGSGWLHEGVPFVMVNTSNPQTINAETLVSDKGPHPLVISNIAETNWAEQMVNLARKASTMRTLAGWGIGIAAFLAIGALFWNVLALGGGLDEVAEAIKSMNVKGAGASPIEGSGHKDISTR